MNLDELEARKRALWCLAHEVIPIIDYYAGLATIPALTLEWTASNDLKNRTMKILLEENFILKGANHAKCK